MGRVLSLRNALVAAGLIGAVAAVVLLPVGEWSVALLRWIEGSGAWSKVLLCVVWIPTAVVLFPGAVLTLGTGFLLGVGWGLVIVSIGSTAGAAAAFAVGRTVARGWVEERIERRPRFQAVDRAVETDGFRIVLLTRLSPLFPYNFQNYAFAVTGVSFRDFLLGSWIGMLPGTLLYIYIGSTAQALATVASGTRERSALEWTFYGVGLAATVAVTWYVTRRARRVLEERTDMEEATG